MDWTKIEIWNQGKLKYSIEFAKSTNKFFKFINWSKENQFKDSWDYGIAILGLGILITDYT